jgi:hypothetical protein
MNYDTTKNKIRYLFNGVEELKATNNSIRFDFDIYSKKYQTAENTITSNIKKILVYDTEWISCNYTMNSLEGFDVPVYWYEFRTYIENLPIYLLPGIKSNMLWKNTSALDLKCTCNNTLILTTPITEYINNVEIVNSLLVTTPETPTADVAITQVFAKVAFRVINPLILR